jgi:hypothetical protein
MSERIVAAAICVDGETQCMPPPNRHHNIMHLYFRETGRCVAPDEQGFITSTGRFVGREEAAKIARAAGQIGEAKKTHPQDELFSEDLW